MRTRAELYTVLGLPPPPPSGCPWCDGMSPANWRAGGFQKQADTMRQSCDRCLVVLMDYAIRAAGGDASL